VSATSEAEVATVGRRIASSRWDPILSGIRAGALDCLQSTLAVIADDAHGRGTHVAFGCRWRFPTRDEDGTVRVQPSVAERLAQAREIFGFRMDPPAGPLDAPALRRLADDAGRIYVVAESYDLSWLPYARATIRYGEMPHSFLLERADDGYTVVDAYYADTEWGAARPTAWAFSATELDEAVGGPGTAILITAASAPPAIDRAAVSADNAAVARAAEPGIDAYIEEARVALESEEGLARLVLDIWLLCRERLLYTEWLGEHPAAAAVHAAAEAWQRLAAQSYLASRRARRGLRPDVTLVEDMARLLRSDVALMASMGDTAPALAEAEIAAAVGEAIGGILELDAATIAPATPLRELPGFDSFRLVEIIDRAESVLGLEFPPGASADDLVDVAGLCRLFVRANEARVSTPSS
jgi:acyl carrier protein